MRIRDLLVAGAAALLVAPAGLGVFVAGDAHAGARLEGARWTSGDPRNSGSTIAPDGQTITTPLTGRTEGSDQLVAGSLQLDVANGRDIDLSFLTDVPWVTCEAPAGLTADGEGRIAFVCRARARGLDGLTERLSVYVKADPTGGLAHRKLYWILDPGAAP